MLEELSKLGGNLKIFQVFDYITFRAGGAAITAFFLVVLFGPKIIDLLKSLRAVAVCRYTGIMAEEYINHKKDETPSMGGVLLIGALTIATVLWAKMSDPVVIILLAGTLSLCALGFIDDYSKLAKKSNIAKKKGISSKFKLIWQLVTAVLVLILLRALPAESGIPIDDFYVPFFKNALWSSPYTILIDILVIVGASNAVNLSDGMDGLATGCEISSVGAYAVIAYLSGHVVFADYLLIPYIPSAGEVFVFAAAIIGACGGFLWYNCHPAAVFMGDTGSLALGGALGMLAVVVRHELLLILIGGVFVMEAGSVALQVPYFKLTHGKRIFLCTPIHHHFQHKKWAETQIVIRFWILAGIFAILGLATLKLR